MFADVVDAVGVDAAGADVVAIARAAELVVTVEVVDVAEDVAMAIRRNTTRLPVHREPIPLAPTCADTDGQVIANWHHGTRNCPWPAIASLSDLFNGFLILLFLLLFWLFLFFFHQWRSVIHQVPYERCIFALFPISYKTLSCVACSRLI